MKWTPEQEHLLRLLLPTNSIQEISEEFERRKQRGIKGFSTERSDDAIRHKLEREGWDADTDVEDIYDEHLRKILTITTEIQNEYEQCSVGLGDEVDRTILCLSDLHFTHALDQELFNATKKYSDADVVVLNGDILDGYMFSTFPKGKSIAAAKEYQCALEFVKHLSENFPHVVLVEGNHDYRVSRALKQANFTADHMTLLGGQVISRLANGEEIDDSGLLVKKHDFGNVTHQKLEPWWVQIGKTIFCHPHGWGGNAPGATVFSVDKMFRDRLPENHYDAIVCGHTHRIYWGVVNNRLLIEQGSMSARADYEHKADLKHGHSMNGYCVIRQDEDGNTLFNHSKIEYLGSQLPPKKKVL